VTENEERLKTAFLLMLDEGLDNLLDIDECLHEIGFRSSDIREMFWTLLREDAIVWDADRKITRVVT
jgi:hypothetical protein